ncbi:MAG: hypothetical protein IPN52_15135 [Micrococcales bacterium]|nr:hypothetical protein [Micrococcales bacterium]
MAQDDTLASLVPNAAIEVGYLYAELRNDPIVWWDPLVLARRTVASCRNRSAGMRRSPRQLPRLVALDDRVRIGLPWIEALLLPDPNPIANSTFLLSPWLIRTRTQADDAGLLPEWQRVVDALVVAGVSSLAPFSE